MSHKRLHFQSIARQGVLRGAQALADAVRVTLGPKSKSVLIERRFGAPLVCNDGVTIVKELSLEDADENLGVQVLRQAAERTGDVVGDGTTTSTLLACALFADGVRNVTAGASAVDIKKGLNVASASPWRRSRRNPGRSPRISRRCRWRPSRPTTTSVSVKSLPTR
jgi:chaperonin GroEL